MSSTWKAGEVTAWRQPANLAALPVIVVQNTHEELALALLPDIDGYVTEGYLEGKQNGRRRWDFGDKS